ncbi:rhamnogalacturonan acetylesterase [Simiduia curdlanivorans]|uniref:Rhamnogalacturonan acetylesterase n=1 Tax=Simiduia curdlanivorans TaxID=1492769 RepID=A0ABV8V137_9GAMM|nr:rhamnogalacturonan acetylesterase [Simiduia curdlanivorans]MDN3637557.1 rhamnogalacturonan acetylesterase [Simiduia curdlanivorans]
MKKIKFRWLLALAFFLLPLTGTANPMTLHMAGDSTMAEKDVKDYPETGWGQPFSVFFDEQVRVINYAKNGRSTRTFIGEGRWQTLIDAVAPGDYVFIQFGHNDESKNKQDRYTSPEQFYNNLANFVQDTRAKKAIPILLTPVTRRYFNGSEIKETHAQYSALTRKLALEEKVVLIDMDTLTRAHFSAQGDEASKLRFMHLAPGLHPNYPKGVTDDTHFNELGAREAAQLVLQDLKRQGHPLAQRLRAPDPKHLQ